LQDKLLQGEVLEPDPGPELDRKAFWGGEKVPKESQSLGVRLRFHSDLIGKGQGLILAGRYGKEGKGECKEAKSLLRTRKRKSLSKEEKSVGRERSRAGKHLRHGKEGAQ